MQKTTYVMRMSDWSSDVCSSDLLCRRRVFRRQIVEKLGQGQRQGNLAGGGHGHRPIVGARLARDRISPNCDLRSIVPEIARKRTQAYGSKGFFSLSTQHVDNPVHGLRMGPCKKP